MKTTSFTIKFQVLSLQILMKSTENYMTSLNFLPSYVMKYMSKENQVKNVKIAFYQKRPALVISELNFS